MKNIVSTIIVFVALLLFACGGVVQAVPPAGEPFLNITFTDVVVPPRWSIVEDNMTRARVITALTSMPDGPLFHRPNWINTTDSRGQPVVVMDELLVPQFVDPLPSSEFNGHLHIWINQPLLTFVEKFDSLAVVLESIKRDMSGFIGPKFRVDTAELIENQKPIGTFNLAPLGAVYVNQTSHLLKFFLSQPPRNGTGVTFDIVPVSPFVTVIPTQISIGWPQSHGWFRVKAGPTPVTTNFNINLNFGLTTDKVTTWNPGPAVFATSIQTLPMEVFSIDDTIAKASKVYSNQPSPAIRVRAERFLFGAMDAVVRPVSNPPGLTFSPENITLTSPVVWFEFTAAGPAGAYTITYDVPDTWTDENGEQQAKDNDLFQPITDNTTITVLSSLNIVLTPLPLATGYMAAVPDGSHGGAFTRELTLALDDLPNDDVTIEVDRVANPNIEMIPPSLSWRAVPLSTSTTANITLRALTQANPHTVTFALSGTSKGDYQPPAPVSWVVEGSNPNCAAGSPSLDVCFGRNGCQFDTVVANACVNTPLPIDLSTLPLLFDGETSLPITITLRAPVRKALNITPTVSDRFTFTPSSIVMAAGETTATFQINAKLTRTDAPGSYMQSFRLLLSGADARHHEQSSFTARVRSTIRCSIDYPSYSMYKAIEVERPFVITCDEPPESNVTFTFKPKTIGRFPWLIKDIHHFDVSVRVLPPANDSASNQTVVLDNTTRRGKYHMTGNSVQVFTATWEKSGSNAVRFSDLPSQVMRVVALGGLQVPPCFSVKQYQQTEFLHLDLSRPPPKNVKVHIQVVDAATDAAVPSSEVLLSPSGTIDFWANQPARQGFFVYGNVTGRYKLRFTMSGPGAIFYEEPTPATHDVLFRIDDPWEGKAIDYWQDFSHLASAAKRRCRLNHGYRSISFDGQAAPRLQDTLCRSIVKRTAPMPFQCSDMATYERCYFALEQQHYPCAWVNKTCTLVEPLLGSMEQFAVGSAFYAFLDDNGTVWTIGEDVSGQLGHDGGSFRLGYVSLPEKIETIAAGEHFVMALGGGGVVYSWGENFAGQLGHDTYTSYTQDWGIVKMPRGENVTCISAGSKHAGLLALSGRAYVWGSNEFGQVGTNTTVGRNTAIRKPMEVNATAINEEPIYSIHLSAQSTSIAGDRTLYTFGSNTMGQLARMGFDEILPAKSKWKSDSEHVPTPTYGPFVKCG